MCIGFTVKAEKQMNDLNYIFFEEFKKLDKLYGELYEAPNGLTHYIDDMKAASSDKCSHIPNWKTDLKDLIRLRHIRNHLAHTEGAFNEDICTQHDINWIKNFHQRIMNQSDPLAMLTQMLQEKKQMPMSDSNDHTLNTQIDNKENEEPNIAYLILTSIGLAIVIILIFFVIFF